MFARISLTAGSHWQTTSMAEQVESSSRLPVAWILPLAVILLWEVAARNRWLPPAQAAAPSKIMRHLFSGLVSGELLTQAGYSVARLAAGVLTGMMLGVLSGLLLAQSYRAHRLVSPFMQFVAPVPVIVWIPFVIMCFGIGELSKIALVALCVFFLLHIHTFQAVREVRMQYVELAAIYQKSWWERVRHIFLPFATPAILTALRVGLGLGWVVLFVVEYGFSRQREGGLGWFIANARGFGRTEDQFAGVILLGLIGFACDTAVARVQTRLVSWSDSTQGPTEWSQP